MKRSHKIRLNPNNEQATLLLKTCGCNRYAYNWLLNQAKENYKNGIKYNKFELKKSFNQFKKTLDFMSEVNAHAVINDAIDKLDRGFKGFFAGRTKHPRFHSKKQGIGSFSLAGSEIKVDGKKVYIGRIGWVNMAEQIRFDYTQMYRITVSNKAGKWFVSFNLEVEDNRACENQTSEVGVDRGVKDLAVCSDGVRVPNPRISNTYQIRLRKLNKELSRRTKGGKNWWKTKIKLQRLHERIANIRSDYIHKFTTDVSKHHGIVCLEKLNVKGMVRNHKLARHISDVAFGEIDRQFNYKAFEVRYVDTFFPSSKMCCVCGYINHELTLSDREWLCPKCNTLHDRDACASQNIKTFAVSSTGIKKPIVKKPLAECPTSSVKVSHG